MVIIIVFVLAGALAAGFSMTRSERIIDDAGRANVYAQSNAETGLQRAMTERASLGLASGTPPATDSVRVTLTHGFADVVVTRVRPVVGTEPAVYLVRSHGYSTASNVAGTPNAEYTATQFATWQAGSMTVKASFMSLTGITKNGAVGEISGIDNCGDSTNVAGVAVPKVPGYSQSGGSIAAVLAGTPLIDSTMGATPAAMAPNVGVNWAGMISGALITPDFTSNNAGVGFPSSTWFAANPGAYPIILVDNLVTETFTVPPGRGMLIIKGNMAISGSDIWTGVVLVGGVLTSNGNNTITGAVITGLNVKLGLTVGTNAVGNGNKDFLYDSCAVASAVAGMGRMRPYKNTWSNTYAVY
ncbi:MAG: hypothetical protein O2973_04225 [Gemmatimonadetes bacterium]|nr:hypothetical protein [Gemmatimonadota bacterium]